MPASPPPELEPEPALEEEAAGGAETPPRLACPPALEEGFATKPLEGAASEEEAEDAWEDAEG